MASATTFVRSAPWWNLHLAARVAGRGGRRTITTTTTTSTTITAPTKKTTTTTSRWASATTTTSFTAATTTTYYPSFHHRLLRGGVRSNSSSSTTSSSSSSSSGGAGTPSSSSSPSSTSPSPPPLTSTTAATSSSTPPVPRAEHKQPLPPPPHPPPTSTSTSTSSPSPSPPSSSSSSSPPAPPPPPSTPHPQGGSGGSGKQHHHGGGGAGGGGGGGKGEHAPKGSGGASRPFDATWAIGSAVVFLPALYYVIKSSDSSDAHHPAPKKSTTSSASPSVYATTPDDHAPPSPPSSSLPTKTKHDEAAVAKVNVTQDVDDEEDPSREDKDEKTKKKAKRTTDDDHEEKGAPSTTTTKEKSGTKSTAQRNEEAKQREGAKGLGHPVGKGKREEESEGEGEGEEEEVVLVSAKDAVPPSSSTSTSTSSSSSTGGTTPDHFQYVLIGGGTASYSAMLGIQELDPHAEILIISGENYAPYQRPPLTKELWFSEDPEVAKNLTFKNWEGKETSLFYEPETAFQTTSSLKPTGTGVKLAKGRKAVDLNVAQQQVTLDDGTKVKYGKVLLATGGAPRTLPFQKNLPEAAQKRVTTYRTLDDFRKLQALVQDSNGEKKRMLVIGGGFLGSELAAALAPKAQVTQIFPEDGNMALVFPKYLTKWTTQQVTDLGVHVQPRSQVTGMHYDREADKVVVEVDGKPQTFDHVIVAVGIEPRVELARQAGLEIDPYRGGLVVNAELEARRNVFGAGDSISFHDVVLGRRRVEHYDNAVLQGRWAGNAMAGQPKPFVHQSMFWSDVGPHISYEAIGILDGSLVTVGVWGHQGTGENAEAPGGALQQPSPVGSEGVMKGDPAPAAAIAANAISSPSDGAPAHEGAAAKAEAFRKGVVFYVRDDTVVGILLFNLHGQIDKARRILLEKHRPAEANDLAKQFAIFD